METDKNQRERKSVFLTGASGFVGRAVCKQLVDQGYQVIALYRSSPPENIEGVLPVCLNLSKTNLLAAPLSKVEAIIHLAWDGGFESSIKDTDGTTRYADTLNLRAMKSLVDAAVDAKIEKFIFLSSIGSNRKAKTDFLKEKYLAEVELVNSSLPCKLILRSNLILNPEADSCPNKINLDQYLREKTILPRPKEKIEFKPVDLQSVCDALLSLLGKKPEKATYLADLSNQSSIGFNDVVRARVETQKLGWKFFLGGYFGDRLMKRSKDPSSLRMLKVLENFANCDEKENPQAFHMKNLGLSEIKIKDSKELF